MIATALSLALSLAQFQVDPGIIVTGARDTGAQDQILSVAGDCKGYPVSIEVSQDTNRVMVRFGENQRDVTADIPSLDIHRRDRSLVKTFPICRFEGDGMEVLFLIADVRGEDITWSWRSFDVDRDLRVSGVETDTPVTPQELARAFD